jgi:hypothetical protein
MRGVAGYIGVAGAWGRWYTWITPEDVSPFLDMHITIQTYLW